MPGEELFEYIDSKGAAHDVGSDDVNAYLKHIGGHDFTAKDFRTWAGTLLCLNRLKCERRPARKKDVKRRLLEAIDHVAQRLGNTRAVCRKSYIHPGLMQDYLEGRSLASYDILI
jgi:DNA topoisomerase-1